jgi:hypothetical protein
MSPWNPRLRGEMTPGRPGSEGQSLYQAAGRLGSKVAALAHKRRTSRPTGVARDRSGTVLSAQSELHSTAWFSCQNT